jgi:hypothetical protein
MRRLLLGYTFTLLITGATQLTLTVVYKTLLKKKSTHLPALIFALLHHPGRKYRSRTIRIQHDGCRTKTHHGNAEANYPCQFPHSHPSRDTKRYQYVSASTILRDQRYLHVFVRSFFVSAIRAGQHIAHTTCKLVRCAIQP